MPLVPVSLPSSGSRNIATTGNAIKNYSLCTNSTDIQNIETHIVDEETVVGLRNVMCDLE